MYNKMTSVLNFANIDVSQISFSEPKTNVRGGQSIWLSYNGQKLILQVPKGKCPFGLGKQQFEEDAPKYDVSLSLGGSEKMNEFREFVTALDERIKSCAVDQSKEWFGKKMQANVIEEFYKPMVVESKKGDYAPTMKFKMPYYDDKFTATIFNDKKEEVDVDMITKGSQVTLIAKVTSMWFVGKQFGVTWQVMQAKVFPGMALPKYAFADEDDNEELEEEYEEEYEGNSE